MKAIVQTGPRSVELQERDVPVLGADEVLIEVQAAGLCGSDAHAYADSEGYEWTPTPRIMGHEYSGRVIETGDDIERFDPGDDVVEEPVHACGQCFQCRNEQPNVCRNFEIIGMHTDGAYAEYRTADPDDLHRIPDSVSLRSAAVAEPLSVATHAVVTRSRTTPGDAVLVEGPGPIGTFTAVVADSIGADVLVSGLERDAEHRFPMLEDLGIDTVNVEEEVAETRMESATRADGFDVVFDSTGHHSGVEMAAEQVRKGGQIVVVGLPAETSKVFMTDLVRGEVDLTTSYGSTWANFEQALNTLANDELDVDRVLDTSFAPGEADDAFEAFLASETCKPVFQFG